MAENAYATLAEVKETLRLSDSVDDNMLDTALGAASRAVDEICGRAFYQIANLAVSFRASFPKYLRTPDLVSVSLVETGDSTGTFTTVASTEYQLEPFDSVLSGRPYTTIQMVGTTSLPIHSNGRPSARITGTWGWPAVPDGVKQATLILTQRLFKRLDSPLGVAGFGDLGAVFVRSVDPDVERLLAPYTLPRVA